MKRTLAGGLFALVLWFSIAPEQGAHATSVSTGSSQQSNKPTTIVLQHVGAAQAYLMIRALYPNVRIVTDVHKNSVTVQGSAVDVASVKTLTTQLDQQVNANTTAASTLGTGVQVFPISDPGRGPQIAAAMSAFIQGLPAPAPSISPGQSNGNVVVVSGNVSSGSPGSTASAPPAVVLTPSQKSLIVRADVRTLSMIASIVMPALQAGTPPAPPGQPSQTYQLYEVRYPIPNPVPSGSTLAATSTVSDLANAALAVINQTGPPQDVRITADPSYPRIVVAGSSAGVANALKILRDLDKKPALVDIEAQVFEVDTDVAKNLGFELPSGSIQTTIGEYSPPTVNVSGALVSPSPQPVFALTKVTRSPISVAAALNVLIQEGGAKLVAHPHVATINGRLTILNITNVIPFVANSVNSAGLAISNVTNYSTGTRLEIVPIINEDGSISAYLHPTYSTLTGYTAQFAPLISSREASTTFRLVSGQAAYISGLQEINDAYTDQKLPGLSSIPLIGKWFFTNHAYQRITTQLFIVLEASIIDRGDLQIAPMESNPDVTFTPKPAPQTGPLPPPPSIPGLQTPSPEPSRSPWGH